MRNPLTIVDAVYQALKKHYTAYLLLSPILIALGAVLYYPMIRGVIMTFYRFGDWVGIGNYIWAISDDLFHYSFLVTLLFLVGTLALQLVIGLLVALVLDKITRFKAFFSALALASYMTPPIAGGIIWYWMYNPSFGLINVTLEFLANMRVYFLTDWPIFSVIIAQTWKDFGYATIIYLAALKQIPHHLYEAADIDGAAPLGKFRFITMPHLKTATFIILAIRTTWNVVEFALPFEMTGGGPGGKSTFLSILLYKTGFIGYDLSRAYVVGMAMIAISLFALFVYIKLFKEGIGGVE